MGWRTGHVFSCSVVAGFCLSCFRPTSIFDNLPGVKTCAVRGFLPARVAVLMPVVILFLRHRFSVAASSGSDSAIFVLSRFLECFHEKA